MQLVLSPLCTSTPKRKHVCKPEHLSAGRCYGLGVGLHIENRGVLIVNAGSLSSEHFLLWACLIEEEA